MARPIHKRSLRVAAALLSVGLLHVPTSASAAGVPFNLSCDGADVMVGVKGSTSAGIDSVAPVCARTEGSVWMSAAYDGGGAGRAGGTPYSLMCSTGQAVRGVTRSVSGSLVTQLAVQCQGLSETGGFIGDVTTLDPVGGGGGKASTQQCASDKPAFGMKGETADGVVKVELLCRQAPQEPPSRPEGLKGVSVPTPSNIGEFVTDHDAAVRLGKALFWDMQLGSDGVQACASCHFHAGADNRSKNSLNPGLARASSPTSASPDHTFQVGGPNYQLTTGDFPFFQREKPDDPKSPVIRDVNDVVSSQGVTLSRFASGIPGAHSDNTLLVSDNLFNVGGLNTRRVADRNTPTTINAVFNFRNFWDGRAQFIFNGVNPFGARDEQARVFRTVNGLVTPVAVRIDNASLASQAVGPPSSIFEMSADGRTLMHIGKRLLAARPLAGQKVAPTDSVLGHHVHSSGYGLSVANYAEMVKSAFRAEWWNGAQAVQIAADGSKKIVATKGVDDFSQMEANFSLFFGLAVQMYEATLVSDDAPFDRYMAGASWELSKEQQEGMKLFFGKGKCANCHGGAEFTNASTRRTLRRPLQRMTMGNGETAVYDQGFYNVAVTRTSDDILVGGRDPFGRPLSNTGLEQQLDEHAFRQMVGVSPNLTVAKSERIAVMGAAKTPTVRNAELTQPFFHNGGVLNLDQLLEFYNRGGNFKSFNSSDVDADIQQLGLSSGEKQKIIAFVKSLTDERVRHEAAPFDHPELKIPAGHQGNADYVANEGGRAADVFVTLPAVGAAGMSGSPAQRNFLDVVE